MGIQTTNALVDSSDGLPEKTLSEKAAQNRRLFGRLVRQVVTAQSLKPFQLTQDEYSDVLLEATLGEVRYCLVRCWFKASDPLKLSPREQAIAQLIAQGLSNKCIGHQLEISPWTVATYIRRIFAKVGVSSRAAMIAKLIERHFL